MPVQERKKLWKRKASQKIIGHVVYHEPRGSKFKINPCSWCSGINVGLGKHLKQVICFECGTSGPFGETDKDAVQKWNIQHKNSPALPSPQPSFSSFISMPKKFKFFNGGTQCDMAVGPCSCGAWHSPQDWNKEVRDFIKKTGYKC